MASSAKKIHLCDADNEILRKSVTGNSCFSDIENNSWISGFKLAMSRTSTRKQKITLLTTIPVQWSMRKIAKEFNVSKRMVSLAVKLRNEKGYCAQPDDKKGRPMNSDLIEKVEQFYLSDDVSRVMPGVKDFKSVKIDGKRTHKTVINS